MNKVFNKHKLFYKDNLIKKEVILKNLRLIVIMLLNI